MGEGDLPEITEDEEFTVEDIAESASAALGGEMHLFVNSRRLNASAAIEAIFISSSAAFAVQTGKMENLESTITAGRLAWDLRV